MREQSYFMDAREVWRSSTNLGLEGWSQTHVYHYPSQIQARGGQYLEQACLCRRIIALGFGAEWHAVH